MKIVFRDACKRIVHIVILLAFPVVFIHQFSTAQLVGTTWTSRASSSDDTWEGVAYGNGLFAAVASTYYGEGLMTSPDGINWTMRISPIYADWKGITYGNGAFVAVASFSTGNRVMRSADGVLWTSYAAASTNSWSGIAFGNGRFVAVATSGTGNRVMTSPTGITWTSRTSAADNNWTSVTYGNGLFVAVAGSGTGNRVMTSPDGITWTLRTTPADNIWTSVTYGNGLFVAVAGSGAGNRVMTSPDGVTWTLRSSAGDLNWRGVTYGVGLFVAVGSSGTGSRVMTSPDGINWTLRTSAIDNNWKSVAYGQRMFVAVSQSGTGNRVMTSGTFVPLPVNWRSVTADLNNAKQARIKWRVDELSVNNYEVEKSIDAIHYTQIGNIPSKGDGDNSYEFTEPQLLADIAWYRIKQIDIDGRFTYSSIIVLRSGNDHRVSAYPNPVKDIVTIVVDKKSLDKPAILTDMYGKTLQSLRIGSLSFTVNLHGYPAGYYILKMENEKPLKIVKE